MNLNNFKNQINTTILERGSNYFEKGYITNLQKLSSGEWLAQVAGNNGDYHVEINLDKKNNITGYSCNCPFDGPVCKHVAAVLFAIREEQNKPVSETKSILPEWESIIKNTPENELRDFLLKFAKTNPSVQNELLVQLSTLPKEVNTAKYETIVARAFSAAEGRHGYIEYRDTHAAMNPIYNLLAKADEHIANGNYHEAFSIVSAVAPQCVEAIQNMDDSNGECGGVIDESFELTGKILQVVQDPQLANKIFEWLYNQIQNPDYDDFGCDNVLEPLFFDWANNKQRRETAYRFIDQQIKESKDKDGWSSEYRQAKYLKFKMHLLNDEGKRMEADQIIEENLHLSDFREMRINEAISQNKIEEAIGHIREGIAQAEKDNYPGIAHGLKDKLLEIYEKVNHTNNIRKLSKELFLENTSTISYFRKYKGTFTREDWYQPLAEIIQKLSKPGKPNYWGPVFKSGLVAVYIEEAMWEQLFNEVKRCNNIEIVEKYYNYLAPIYHDELIPMYKNAILKFAEQTGRNVYATLVTYLNNLAKLQGGKTVAKELMLELLEKYKNRPAMKDEFKKVGIV